MSTIVQQFDHSLALSFFGIGIKIDLFQSGVTGLETMKKKKEFLNSYNVQGAASSNRSRNSVSL